MDYQSFWNWFTAGLDVSSYSPWLVFVALVGFSVLLVLTFFVFFYNLGGLIARKLDKLISRMGSDK